MHEAGTPLTTGRVQRHLAAGLAHPTVMTVLARLPAKDAVTRRREGGSFVWMPAADEAGLAALQMGKVLDGEQDRRAVPASLVAALREGDERPLRELLDQTADDAWRWARARSGGAAVMVGPVGSGRRR
ncbi:BlaI/MecI/CopY family transcriptional regulator [Streptomyces sp. NPDC002076]